MVMMTMIPGRRIAQPRLGPHHRHRTLLLFLLLLLLLLLQEGCKSTLYLKGIREMMRKALLYLLLVVLVAIKTMKIDWHARRTPQPP